MFQNIQPAVKKETKRVAVMTAVGLLLMWAAFFILHQVFPEKVPFDYTVLLGGLCGALVAAGNFFFMGLAIQKVAADPNEDSARTRMKASYSQRTLIQMLWVVLAVVLPCFHFAAGIIPLFFPGFGIKLTGILGRKA